MQPDDPLQPALQPPGEATAPAAGPASDATCGTAESLYAAWLERHPGGGSPELEQLCRLHPEAAEELRALHGVQRLLAEAAGPLEAPGATPVVPGFACLRPLGRGGMGEVWEAVELAIDRRVALKLLPLTGAEDPRELERWRREILAAGRLRHPNIVALYSAGESGGRRWSAHELIAEGRTLRDEIEELRRLGQAPLEHERRTAERFARLADALQAAHAAGVVHRDLKPQNILLEPDGTPKLADFGVAKLAGAVSLSRTGEFVGTYHYASPEQIDPRFGPVGPRSDVFSLGVTLYEALTFERPFSGDDLRSITHRILREDPVEPRALRGRIPAELSVICLAALEKQPERRYASAGALRDDLLRFVRHEPILARAPSPLRRLQKWGQRHPTVATAVALSAAAFVAISLLFVQSARRAHDLERANELLHTTNEALAQARDVARTEADVSKEVEAFLGGMFRAADPALFGRGALDLEQVIARATERLRAGEVSDPRVRVRLLSQVGELQSRLGGWTAAAELLQEAVDLWRELGQDEAPEALKARCGLAVALQDLGRSAESEALLEPLVERRRRAEPLDAEVAYLALVNLGRSLVRRGELAPGDALLNEARALLDAAPDLDTGYPVVLDVLLAESAFYSGRFEQTLELLGPSCVELEPLLTSGNSVALDAFNVRGLALRGLGRAEEAAEAFARLLPIAAQRLGEGHPRSINLRINLATAWMDQRRADEAERVLEEALALAEASLGEASSEALMARTNLGSVYTAQGRLELAEELLARAVDLYVEHKGPEHIDTAMSRSALAICLFRQGRANEAAELQELALESVADEFAERAKMQGALEIYRKAAAR